MILTDAERTRFAEYCAKRADEDLAMFTQAINIRLPAIAVNKFRDEGNAWRIVAKILQNTESMSLSTDETSSVK